MFEKPVSAPVSTVLKELLNGRKASQEQLLRVLEERREILTRCMKNFSQKTLGQLACVDSGNGFYHELQKDRPRVVSLDNEFNLDTRGLFAGNLFNRKKNGKGETLAFGIDSASWLLVKTTYIKSSRESEYERALSVEVTRTDLPTILEEIGIEPSLVWMYFKITTEEWVSNRKNLYDQACAVAKGMNEEDCIFLMIS